MNSNKKTLQTKQIHKQCKVKKNILQIYNYIQKKEIKKYPKPYYTKILISFN